MRAPGGARFTGFGWTYDWSPQSDTHFGVTGFIVPKDTEVAIGAAQSPEAFCSGAAR